jgi:ADP-ribosylglycohydrolase
MSPWDTGRGQLAADAALMAIAPVGLINVGDPAQAYRDGFLLAGLHQDGLERDAAAAVAAGTAVALMPDATAGDVVEAMASQASYQVRRLVHAGVELADRSAGVEDLVERFYATMLDPTFPTPPGEEWDPERSVAATSREVLPAVVAVLLACPGDPNEAIIQAAGIGRDADTIASVVGCLAGSMHGAEALRSHWVDSVEAANADFFAELTGDPQHGFVAMADQMVGAIESERNALQRRLDLLTELLRTDG